MRRSTFRILFYIKRSNPKKNGNVVIMCRITIDGERAQFSTKLEIHPDKWDNKTGRAKGNTSATANMNRLLDNIRTKSDAGLFPLVQELHEVLRENSADREEYKRYIGSLKSSVLTAFYTPKPVIDAIASVLKDSGVRQIFLTSPWRLTRTR